MCFFSFFFVSPANFLELPQFRSGPVVLGIVETGTLGHAAHRACKGRMRAENYFIGLRYVHTPKKEITCERERHDKSSRSLARYHRGTKTSNDQTVRSGALSIAQLTCCSVDEWS